MKYLNMIRSSLLVLLLLFFSTCNKAEKTLEETTGKSEVVNPEAEAKQFIEIDVEELKSAKEGDIIGVMLNGGPSYSLVIIRVEETMPGILSFSANVGDKNTGQATFILREGKLAGRVSMYSDGASFKLAFDEESGRHFISPINPNDRDVLPGGVPLD